MRCKIDMLIFPFPSRSSNVLCKPDDACNTMQIAVSAIPVRLCDRVACIVSEETFQHTIRFVNCDQMGKSMTSINSNKILNYEKEVGIDHYS